MALQDVTSALMNTDEAAHYLRLSVHTVRAWSREGKLKTVKLGRLLRFRLADLDDFVEAQSRP
jgi:excisionase family DNA binding protein